MTLPQGDTLLVRNLKRGQTAQIGARTQLFDTTGDAAWAIDAHVAYFFNRGTNGDIVTHETEPVTIHSLHRTAVGLGLGRDWFLFRRASFSIPGTRTFDSVQTLAAVGVPAREF